MSHKEVYILTEKLSDFIFNWEFKNYSLILTFILGIKVFPLYLKKCKLITIFWKLGL